MGRNHPQIPRTRQIFQQGLAVLEFDSRSKMRWAISSSGSRASSGLTQNRSLEASVGDMGICVFISCKTSRRQDRMGTALALTAGTPAGLRVERTRMDNGQAGPSAP